MSILRECDRTVTFECDNCGESEASGEEDFNDALRYIKDEDWAIRKDGDSWLHICPECLEDEVSGAFS